MQISPYAGKPALPSMLIDVPKLEAFYYSEQPDMQQISQRVSFGTSGHRGSSLKKTFNEAHILAITQAICDYRRKENIDGPLFIGRDTHALSMPAFISALEVLAANFVQILCAEKEEYTPTPVISHAICKYNFKRKKNFADGIVITPSHNPPDQGGFKYDPPHGGPAEPSVTDWIEKRANEYLEKKLAGIQRISFEKAYSSASRYDYLDSYVDDLGNVIDMEIIKKSGLHLGVDPLGGAGVHYWKPIAERYGLHLDIVNTTIDPTFRFMTVDWDGQIRMDPSSPYAMQRLIGLKDRFDIAFACDPDHDRHGIVTKSSGLLPPNHYLSAAILYLFQNRPRWRKDLKVGKTVVSTRMIDHVCKKIQRTLYEVPVGFKWFVEGFYNGSLGFGGEESAGASFLRLDGSVWATDKDGIILALLSAEMTATLHRDPGEVYRELTEEFGISYYDRDETKATLEQKKKLKTLSKNEIQSQMLAGEKIQSILTSAPGNSAPIDGVKVDTQNGWFAARPSGTEEIYKIYAESFKSKEHLASILDEAKSIVDKVLK